jgi:hypothetical protein|eukprot:COSAG02_NODE_1403_length_12811_cov_8.982536_8_plen_86_part_00
MLKIVDVPFITEVITRIARAFIHTHSGPTLTRKPLLCAGHVDLLSNILLMVPDTLPDYQRNNHRATRYLSQTTPQLNFFQSFLLR